MIALIAVIALYFIIYYIDHYLNFLAVNESSAGFLPAAEMFHSGMGLVLAYTLLAAGILVLSSQFAWLAGILQPVKALLLRFLRFLLSGKGEESEEEIEIPIIEELQNDNADEMTLPEATEPFWLWKVLEVIAIAVLIVVISVAVVLSLIKLFQLIRQYLNLHLQKELDAESEDACDFREKCGLEHNSEKKRQSLFNVLSPHEGSGNCIRRSCCLQRHGSRMRTGIVWISIPQRMGAEAGDPGACQICMSRPDIPIGQ